MPLTCFHNWKENYSQSWIHAKFRQTVASRLLRCNSLVWLSPDTWDSRHIMCLRFLNFVFSVIIVFYSLAPWAFLTSYFLFSAKWVSRITKGIVLRLILFFFLLPAPPTRGKFSPVLFFLRRPIRKSERFPLRPKRWKPQRDTKTSSQWRKGMRSSRDVSTKAPGLSRGP